MLHTGRTRFSFCKPLHQEHWHTPVTIPSLVVSEQAAVFSPERGCLSRLSLQTAPMNSVTRATTSEMFQGNLQPDHPPKY